MKKIKICHMTSAHKSNDTRIFQKQCVGIASLPEYEVYLVAQGYNRIEKDVKVIGIGNVKGSRLSRMRMTTRQIYDKALEVDADIYQIHDPELLPYAMKLKKQGKKVVFDSHEDMFNQILIKNYIPKYFRKIIAYIYRMYETKISQKLDGIIFPCAVDGKHPFENRSKRYIYINNVPILKKYDDIEKKEIAFCYVGSLTENRGVTNLLKAYQLTDKKNKLILAGNFESDAYENFLRENNLLDDVDYRGFCTREQVEAIYNEASIGISNLLNIGQYPRLGTFPTKVFEYMSKGLPVIVSKYQFSQNIIAEYNIGYLIDPSNIEELASIMSLAVKNSNLLKDMGIRGRKLIEEKFNWNIELKNLSGFYKEIINEN